jgi:hypothetical protein
MKTLMWIIRSLVNAVLYFFDWACLIVLFLRIKSRGSRW